MTGTPDDPLFSAILRIIDQIPGRRGDWMNVKFAIAVERAVRANIADEIRAMPMGDTCKFIVAAVAEAVGRRYGGNNKEE